MTVSFEPGLVSVMMPARNVAKVVEQTIRSVQAQTYAQWELVFVDDGSTDNTLRVVQALAADDPRIQVFPMPHGGRGRARNACVERCRGEFVAVCDADDVSFADRFEKQVRYLQVHPEIGAVGAWWVPFSGSSPTAQVPVRRFPTLPDELASAFARGKMRFHNATVMLRTELFRRFGAYNVELRRAQDYEFFARLSRRGVKFAALPEPLLYYRQEFDIQSFAYFVENGMFMSFADRVLAGKNETFESFAGSISGKAWRAYYTAKYGYYHAKMSAMGALGR